MKKVELKNGDTYYFPIEYNEYKYLLITKVDETEYIKKLKRTNPSNKKLFYVSLYKELPNEGDTLSNFIISSPSSYYSIALPLDGNDHRTFEEIEKDFIIGAKPDEFMDMYVYLFEILFEKDIRKMQRKFQYLGNFEYKHPKNEYIPKKFSNGVSPIWIDDNLSKTMINKYENYNLKKCSRFDKSNIKGKIDFDKKNREISKIVHDSSIKIYDMNNRFIIDTFYTKSLLKKLDYLFDNKNIYLCSVYKIENDKLELIEKNKKEYLYKVKEYNIDVLDSIINSLLWINIYIVNEDISLMDIKTPYKLIEKISMDLYVINDELTIKAADKNTYNSIKKVIV